MQLDLYKVWSSPCLAISSQWPKDVLHLMSRRGERPDKFASSHRPKSLLFGKPSPTSERREAQDLVDNAKIKLSVHVQLRSSLRQTTRPSSRSSLLINSFVIGLVLPAPAAPPANSRSSCNGGATLGSTSALQASADLGSIRSTFIPLSNKAKVHHRCRCKPKCLYSYCSSSASRFPRSICSLT